MYHDEVYINGANGTNTTIRNIYIRDNRDIPATDNGMHTY